MLIFCILRSTKETIYKYKYDAPWLVSIVTDKLKLRVLYYQSINYRNGNENEMWAYAKYL
jgi:hypothetical protein